MSHLLKLLTLCLGVLISAAIPAQTRAQTQAQTQAQTLKIATVAPDGTNWMKEMRKGAREVSMRTAGRVKFKFFPGGIMGSEKSVLRKIRIGQLHSAGFTGVGLGRILPQVRVLELPFLFFRDAEVDFVHERVDARLARAFEEKGFVLLGWAEVGLVHLFSKKPVRTKSDLKGLKPWAWEGDPLAKAYFEALQVTPVSLSVIDVLTSLQTGLIDTVYASPLGAIALQWFTKVKYMTALPVTNATGAIVVSKKIFERLTPDQQRVLKAEGKRHFDRLIRLSREDNRKSIEEIRKEGVEVLPLPPAGDLQEFIDVGRSTWERLSGRLYPPDLLAEVLDALKEYRKLHPLPGGGKN